MNSDFAFHIIDAKGCARNYITFYKTTDAYKNALYARMTRIELHWHLHQLADRVHA